PNPAVIEKVPDLDAVLAYAATKPGLTVLRLPASDGAGQPVDPLRVLSAGQPATADEAAGHRRLRKMTELQARGKLRIFLEPGEGGRPRQLTVRRYRPRSRDARLPVRYRVESAAEDVPLGDAARGYALNAE